MTMIPFQKIEPSHKDAYLPYLHTGRERGCEYSFANLFLWGRQQAALVNGYLTIFSQFEKRSLYPFPVGQGNIQPVLDAIIHDARARGIVCRITGMNAEECMLLEELYPGQFRFYPDRDSCDYVYKIEDLATLKGRKFQKKRNHLNKFKETHPDCVLEPITAANLEAVREMTQAWYAGKLADNPQEDYHLEQRALRRAFNHMQELGLEGAILTENGRILAMTMGSALSDTTFDIHFEKALDESAYVAINQAFAAYLQEKYPNLRYLDREDDMGIPGLRKAKLSYQPDHLLIKFWARLWEDSDED
jgi:hypothetical protein